VNRRARGAFNGPVVALAFAAGLLAGAPGSAAEGEVALERFVKQDCGSCHGLTLKGGLGPDIRPDAIAHHDRETLRLIIADGIPGTPMPPWGPLLTTDEIEWIVEFLMAGSVE